MSTQFGWQTNQIQQQKQNSYMETLTLEQPQTVERLLTFENLPEQERIRNEIQTRCSILNRFATAGLDKESIISITASPESLEKHIWKLQLEQNKKLAELVNAGIKSEASLPPELQTLRFNLQAWRNYQMPSKYADKFENLTFDNGLWSVDEETLEKLFIQQRCKVFITGEAIAEYKAIQSIIDEM